MNQPPQDPYYPQTPPPTRSVVVSLPVVRPIVAYILMGVCILTFILQMASQAVLGGDLPAALGMKVNELIIQGEFWRLFTPMFLHGSVLHIAFNMYALYIFGPGLERSYGHWRFLALFLISGFAGNVFSFLFTSAPSLGSSTAIFGLLGAEGIFLFTNRKLFGAGAQRALGNIVLVALLNLGIGTSPGIDNWGHVGGLLGGTFFAWFAGPVYELIQDIYNPQLVDRHGMVQTLLFGAVSLVVFAALAAMKILR